VDELHLTICPRVLGGQRAPTIADGPDPRRLSDAARLRLVWMRRMGSELFLRYCVRKEGRKWPATKFRSTWRLGPTDRESLAAVPPHGQTTTASRPSDSNR